MTPTQLRAALERLELSQMECSRLLRVDGRTVRKWIAGDSEIPTSVTMLLNLLVKGKVTANDLQRSINFRD